MQRSHLCIPKTYRLLACAVALAAFSLSGGLAQRRTTRPAPPVEPIAPVPPKPSRALSAGTFTDRTGAKSIWSVDDKHTLIWNNRPYFPVGGTFTPRSLSDSDEAAWQTDRDALSTLQSKGLLDLVIMPEKSLPEIPPAALQRLVDFLDSNGFRYGLGFGPGMNRPLVGIVVKPGSYRYDTRDSLTAQWQVEHALSALFLLTDIGNENKVVRIDALPIPDRVLTVPIEPPPGSTHLIALLYPRKSLPAASGSLPDLWNGFDSYRDQLLATLSKVQFGSGLRFFLDPLAREIGLSGESDFLVPDPGGFNLEFEAYLSTRYASVEEAKQNWAVAEGDFKTFTELTRLIPLWVADRGVPYFFDPFTSKMYRIVDARQSKWWNDFLQCRNDGIVYYMNALASVLKKQVANVPVVYTCTQNHPIFLNAERDAGYDGLNVRTGGVATELLPAALAPTYSLARQAKRTLWCTAIQGVSLSDRLKPGTRTTTLQDTSDQEESMRSRTTRNAMFEELNMIRRVGYKGLFVHSFQAGTEESRRGVGSWVNIPESLTWLKDYVGVVEGDLNAASYLPAMLFYPLSAPGPAKTGFIGDSRVLWLGSFAQGTTLDWWPSFSGYLLRYDDSYSEYVVVSLQGPRKAHFLARNPKLIEARQADGTPVPIKILDRITVEIPLDDRPTIIVPGGQSLFPREASEDVIVQLAALHQEAVRTKLPSAEEFLPVLDRARFSYRQKDYETAYSVTRAGLEELIIRAAPYIWLEGEAPFKGVHSFSEIAANVEASRERYLLLSSPNPPGRFGYGARYTFDVPADGTYNIWLACTVPGGNTSPIQWRINSMPEQDVSDPRPRGPRWLGERMGWILLGSARLQRGPGQSLSITVTGPAPNSKEYLFAVDAILITPNPFEPRGTVRPLPIEPERLKGVKP
jgi:hypothetical protein